MDKIIGITYPVNDFFKPYGGGIYADILKQQYMLADVICIPDLDVAREIAIENDVKIPKWFEEQAYDLPTEIEWLESKGVICSTPKGYNKDREKIIDSFFGHQRYIISEWLESESKRLTPLEFLKTYPETLKINAILNVYEVMERLNDTTNGSVVSLVDTFDSKSQAPVLYFENVLKIVLTKIPIPTSQDIPWDDLIAFRNESESKEKNLSLRRWMRKVAKGNLLKAELEEEIEWRINDYTKYMEIQKIKYRWSTLETLTKIPFEILENLLKIKWSNIVKPLFELKSHKIKSMEAEFNAPSKEISYIIETRKKLK